RTDTSVDCSAYTLAVGAIARLANRAGGCPQTAQEGKSPGSNTSPAGGRGNSWRKGRSGSFSGPRAAGNCFSSSEFMVSQSRIHQLPQSPRPIDDAATPRWLHHRGG